MAVAAFQVQVALMEEIYVELHCLIDESMIREAVKGGRCDALRWLHAKLMAPGDARGPEDRPIFSPEHSAFEMLQFLSRDLLCEAADKSDLEMLQTLLELMRGHFEIIGNMQVYRAVTLQAAKIAVRHSHVRIIEWLRLRFDLPSEADMDEEAHTGPLAVDKKTLGVNKECRDCSQLDTDQRCTMWRMDNAAAAGRLEDVVWFHTNQTAHGCSHRALELAATSSYLDIVQWLCENKSEE